MGKLGGHLVVFSLPYPISAAPAGVALPPGAAGLTLHEEHEVLRLLAPVVRRSCWTPISMLTDGQIIEKICIRFDDGIRENSEYALLDLVITIILQSVTDFLSKYELSTAA